MTKAEIRRMDTYVREQVRKRGCCQKCGSHSYLQTSHIYSRRYMNLRFRPENVHLLCAKCHLWWHHKPVEAIEWAHVFMGEQNMDALKVMSRTTGKGLTPDIIKSWWT